MPDLFFLSIWYFQIPKEGRIPVRTERIFSLSFSTEGCFEHSVPELAVSAPIGELLQIKFRDNINVLLLINGKVKSQVRDKKVIF